MSKGIPRCPTLFILEVILFSYLAVYTCMNKIKIHPTKLANQTLHINMLEVCVGLDFADIIILLKDNLIRIE